MGRFGICSTLPYQHPITCELKSIDKHVDIGWTWYAKSYQRTAINTSCKLLLLTYAFETLEFKNVYFKVDTNNQPSQSAIARLGARFIGVIKNYQTIPGKKPQNLIHYGINLLDWPIIKQELLSRIDAYNF